MRRYSHWTHEIAARSNTPASLTDRVLRELIALAEESGAPMPPTHVANIYGWESPSDVLEDLRNGTYEWTEPSTATRPIDADHAPEPWPMKARARQRMKIAKTLSPRKHGRQANRSRLAADQPRPEHHQEDQILWRNEMATDASEEDERAARAHRAKARARRISPALSEKQARLGRLDRVDLAPAAPRLTFRQLLADLNVPAPDQEEAIQLLTRIARADEYASWSEIAQYLFEAMRRWNESPANLPDRSAIDFLREILTETEEW